MNYQKKKGTFLTKLSKILFIVLALLVIAVFGISSIWKYTKTDEDIPTPTPTPEEEFSKPIINTRTRFKTIKKMKAKKNLDKKAEETTTIIPDPESKNLSLNEDAVQYEIEPEATSAHFTQKLAEIATASSLSAERSGLINAYIQNGVDPNQVIDNNSPMFLAARGWNVHLLKELGRIDFAAATEDGWTIMHIICEKEPKTEEEKKRSIETLQYLIEQGGDIDSKNAINGYTPLMYAIEKGNSETAIILLDHGSNACGPIKKGFEVNPLMLAARSNNMLVIIHLLGKGAEILAYSKDGISALQEAVIFGQLSLVRLFIGKLKQQAIDNPQDIQVPEPTADEEIAEEWSVGATLLHFAVFYNQFEVAQHLIMHYQADRSLRDKKNCLALDHSRFAVKVYTEDANRDPEQFQKAKNTAENILKLFESTEADRLKYIADRHAMQVNLRNAEANRKLAAKERAEIDAEIERRRLLGLL